MRMMQLTMIQGSIVNEDEIAEEVTCPVMIDPEKIRCFYPRKHEKPGTRITFADGGGFAVSESFAEVCTAIAAMNGAA